MTTLQFKRREHQVKTWPAEFEAQLCGDVSFQVRYNMDRHFQRGDILIQHEFVPNSYPGAASKGNYTERTMKHEIVSVYSGHGISPGYVVLQLAPIGDIPWERAKEISMLKRVQDAFDEYDDKLTNDSIIALVREVLRCSRLPGKRPQERDQASQGVGTTDTPIAAPAAK